MATVAAPDVTSLIYIAGYSLSLAVLSLYLYMLVVETFTAENIKLQVYTTIGWGAPAVFVAIWVLITKLRSANTLETEQYRKATKALLVLIPLLGITYLLVIYGPSDDSWFAHAFDYMRAVMLST
ncbi:Diuretic hormone receptor, partial [Operophtera brumata]